MVFMKYSCLSRLIAERSVCVWRCYLSFSFTRLITSCILNIIFFSFSVLFFNMLAKKKLFFEIKQIDAVTTSISVWRYYLHYHMLKNLSHLLWFCKKVEINNFNKYSSLFCVLFLQGNSDTSHLLLHFFKKKKLWVPMYTNLNINITLKNYNLFYPTLRSLRLVKQFKQDVVISDFLIRFLEYLFGCKVNLFIWTKLQMILSVDDLLRSFLFFHRIFYSMTTNSVVMWYGFAECVTMVAITKDVRFLISWIRIRLRGMTLFRHGRFFQLILYYLQYFLTTFGNDYGIIGFRLDVRGKISVTGNARKRIILFKYGLTSFRNVSTKVISDFFLVRTDTGCLGVTVWVFYR